MPGDNRPKTILWIENDSELIRVAGRLLRKRLAPSAVEIETVCHRAEAADRLQKDLGSYFALIVDVMLPKDATALAEIERLDKRRGELLDEIDELRQKSDPGARTKLIKLKMQIDDIDEKIDRETDLEGGIDLIQSLPPQARPLKLPTIFLTARSLGGLKERAARLIETGKFYWLPKPRTAESIVAIIEEHLRK